MKKKNLSLSHMGVATLCVSINVLSTVVYYRK